MTLRPPRKILILLAALLMALALLAQFAGAWQLTHGIVAALVFFGCLQLVRAVRGPVGRRGAVLSLVWGMPLALSYMVGASITAHGTMAPQGHPVALALRFLGLSLFFACVCRWMLESGQARATPEPSKRRVRLWFFLSWGVLVLCYLFYYLAFYPGIFSSDTVTQFAQAYDLADLDNTHSLAHTLLLKLALLIGDGIGIEYRLTYGLLTLFQMLGLAAVMAYAVALLQKQVRSTALSVFALLNFALNPLHGYYAVTLWKDIPFSAMLLLLTLLLWKAVYTRGAVLAHWGYRIAFACCLLPLTLFRGNGILVTLPVLVLLSLLWGKGRGFFVVMCGVVLLSWGGLRLYCQQQQYASPSLVEVAAVPMQQIARVVSKEEPLTQEQIDGIEYLLPLEGWAQHYNQRLTDSIKFAHNFYGQAINDQPMKYLKLWLSVVRDHPATTLEAYLAHMMGFYYPDHIPGTTVYYPNESINDWDKEFYNQPVIPALSAMLQLKPDKMQERFPVFNLLQLPGPLIWVVFLALICLYTKGQRRLMVVTLPALTLWVGLMLGAPVSDARYSYGLFLVLPVMLGLCVLSKHPVE